MVERITIRGGTPAPSGERSTFGSRGKLFADLDEVIATAESSKLIVLVEFVGLKQYADAVGQEASDELLARLGDRLVALVGSSGSFYSLRRAELCALVDDSAEGRTAFLDDLEAALGKDVDVYEVTPTFGIALVPDEAAAPLEALEIADQRLNVQKLARDPSRRPLKRMLAQP